MTFRRDGLAETVTIFPVVELSSASTTRWSSDEIGTDPTAVRVALGRPPVAAVSVLVPTLAPSVHVPETRPLASVVVGGCDTDPRPVAAVRVTLVPAATGLPWASVMPTTTGTG